MTLDELQAECYRVAASKGWHDPDMDAKRTFGDMIALMHSELSEALKEHRAGREFGELYYTGGAGSISLQHKLEFAPVYDRYKPEGVAVELADCVIRILDWFEMNELSAADFISMKLDYNSTRPHRHGNKVT